MNEPPGVALAAALRLLLAAYPPPKTRAQIAAWNAVQRALEAWAVSPRNPDRDHETPIPE